MAYLPQKLLPTDDPVEYWDNLQQRFDAEIVKIEETGMSNCHTADISPLDEVAMSIAAFDNWSESVVRAKEINIVSLVRVNMGAQNGQVASMAQYIYNSAHGQQPDWETLDLHGVGEEPDRDVPWKPVRDFWSAVKAQDRARIGRSAEKLMASSPGNPDSLSAKARIASVFGAFRLALNAASVLPHAERDERVGLIYSLAACLCIRPRDEVLMAVVDPRKFSAVREVAESDSPDWPALFKVTLVSAGSSWGWLIWEDALRLGLLRPSERKAGSKAWRL